MVVELKGQQVRIREHSPSKYSEFRTQDMGESGKLQRIAGYSKRTGWETQAWRINLSDYPSEQEALKDLNSIRTSASHKANVLLFLLVALLILLPF